MKKYFKYWILCCIFGAILGFVGLSIIEHPIKFIIVCLPFWIAPHIYPKG